MGGEAVLKDLALVIIKDITTYTDVHRIISNCLDVPIPAPISTYQPNMYITPFQIYLPFQSFAMPLHVFRQRSVVI